MKCDEVNGRARQGSVILQFGSKKWEMENGRDEGMNDVESSSLNKYRMENRYRMDFHPSIHLMERWAAPKPERESSTRLVGDV